MRTLSVDGTVDPLFTVTRLEVTRVDDERAEVCE